MVAVILLRTPVEIFAGLHYFLVNVSGINRVVVEIVLRVLE